jgi:hypothetical protein
MSYKKNLVKSYLNPSLAEGGTILSLKESMSLIIDENYKESGEKLAHLSLVPLVVGLLGSNELNSTTIKVLANRELPMSAFVTELMVSVFPTENEHRSIMVALDSDGALGLLIKLHYEITKLKIPRETVLLSEGMIFSDFKDELYVVSACLKDAAEAGDIDGLVSKLLDVLISTNECLHSPLLDCDRLLSKLDPKSGSSQIRPLRVPGPLADTPLGVLDDFAARFYIEPGAILPKKRAFLVETLFFVGSLHFNREGAIVSGAPGCDIKILFREEDNRSLWAILFHDIKLGNLFIQE